mmetsp:Transcript_44016/g.71635  ORF Transcript_44016/g.71635 Transcript_44016/m.71635 type:complete len:456 (+) Transcript_44016:314-1681(+)|eukprot:CAMPEP_0184665134 /NCGR_PEP_ID=MMETSP0308-20130426/55868_1 /TAXON_ID=38269 /ORGANISM="Gloeochaete witrockiana, Strain SAG 46.84" /LENGTH=455 /DNA_ID=CAMNT_0027108941 /DNA_START=246 /DNA_END=1613 /DNA_ORIENTATION=+
MRQGQAKILKWVSLPVTLCLVITYLAISFDGSEGGDSLLFGFGRIADVYVTASAPEYIGLTGDLYTGAGEWSGADVPLKNEKGDLFTGAAERSGADAPLKSDRLPMLPRSIQVKGHWAKGSVGMVNFTESPLVKQQQRCLKRMLSPLAPYPKNRLDEFHSFRWFPQGSTKAWDPKLEQSCLKGKKIAFVGDSTIVQEATALVCQLSALGYEYDLTKLPDTNYTRRPWTQYEFPALKTKITASNHPFLLHAYFRIKPTKIFFDRLAPELVRLLETRTDMIVLNLGHWAGVNSAAYPDDVKKNSTWVYAHYKRLLSTTLDLLNDWFLKHAPVDYQPLILFKSTTGRHFEKGDWFSGGRCFRTEPIEYPWPANYNSNNNKYEYTVELNRMAQREIGGREFLFDLLYMDTTNFDHERADGHSTDIDCLHWMHPGIPDFLNTFSVRELCKHSKALSPSAK